MKRDRDHLKEIAARILHPAERETLQRMFDIIDALCVSETREVNELWDRPDIYRGHTIDIVTRKDGVERRYEGDFLKRVAQLLRG